MAMARIWLKPEPMRVDLAATSASPNRMSEVNMPGDTRKASAGACISGASGTLRSSAPSRPRSTANRSCKSTAMPDRTSPNADDPGKRAQHPYRQAEEPNRSGEHAKRRIRRHSAHVRQPVADRGEIEHPAGKDERGDGEGQKRE